MEELLKNIKQLTKVAIEDAEKAFNIHLDYSHKSIEKIEEILSSYHEKSQAGTLTDQMAQIIGTGYGCYVGETLIKQLGFGEWVAPTEGPTAGEWILDIKGTHCLFPSKAIRRIKNGPEDTVVTMYQMVFNNNSDEKISLKIF